MSMTRATTDEPAGRATRPVCSGKTEPVCSSKTFLRILAREQAMTQRCNYSYSILELLFQSSTLKSADIGVLEHTVSAHIRDTDIAGWFDKNCLGVILPATSAQAAEKLADRIIKDIPHFSAGLRRNVYECGPSAFDTKMHGCDSTADRSAAVEPPLRAMPLARLPRWKRFIDVLISSVALICLMPLFVVLVVGIELVSPGPFLFKQERVGYMGRHFKCLKFRSMRPDAAPEAHHDHVATLLHNGKPLTKLENTGEETRLIPLGRVMRATGMDELPQLFNVLVGEMSLVGPRPCIPYEFNQFEAWHKERCMTLPGLTGLWQVSGKNSTTFEEMMRFDIWYAKHRSLRMDFDIMLRTPCAIWSQLRTAVTPGTIAWNKHHTAQYRHEQCKGEVT